MSEKLNFHSNRDKRESGLDFIKRIILPVCIKFWNLGSRENSIIKILNFSIFYINNCLLFRKWLELISFIPISIHITLSYLRKVIYNIELLELEICTFMITRKIKSSFWEKSSRMKRDSLTLQLFLSMKIKEIP